MAEGRSFGDQGDNSQMDAPVQSAPKDPSPAMSKKAPDRKAGIDTTLSYTNTPTEKEVENDSHSKSLNCTAARGSADAGKQVDVPPAEVRDATDSTQVEVNAPTVDEAVERVSPSHVEVHHPLISSGIAEVQGTDAGINEVDAQNPQEHVPAVELEKQPAVDLEIDYTDHFLGIFENGEFNAKYASECLSSILVFAIGLRKDFEGLESGNQVLHDNMVLLQTKLDAANQANALLAERSAHIFAAHNSLEGMFTEYQKKRSQKEIHKKIDDTKTNLRRLENEIQRLREPDILIKDLSDQVKGFETRFQRIETAVKAEVLKSKKARQGIGKDKNLQDQALARIKKKLEGFREHLDELRWRLDEKCEAESLTQSTSRAQGTDLQANKVSQEHQSEYDSANIDELALVKGEILKVSEGLAELKQERECREDELQQDLDVLREHVTEWIREQEPNRDQLSGTRPVIDRLITNPPAITSLTNADTLMGTALAALIQKQDEKNEFVDKEIARLGKHTAISWDAIHSVHKQGVATANFASITATAVNKTILAMAAQARRTEEGLNDLDDRLEKLQEEAGELKSRKKQCLQHVGEAQTGSTASEECTELMHLMGYAG